MQTDIVLQSVERAVVIDTKYYAEALVKNRFGGRKVRSDHLYQIFSYLSNYTLGQFPREKVHGMLLYPSVSTEVNLRYELHGHPVAVRSLNLGQPWPAITSDLLALLPAA